MPYTLKPVIIKRKPPEHLVYSSSNLLTACGPGYRIKYHKQNNKAIKVGTYDATCPDAAPEIQLHEQDSACPLPEYFWVCCNDVRFHISWKTRALIFGGIALVAILVAVWQWLK
jgi:hypothetical protein